MEEFFYHLCSIRFFPEVPVTDHIVYEGNVVLHGSFDLVLHTLQLRCLSSLGCDCLHHSSQLAEVWPITDGPEEFVLNDFSSVVEIDVPSCILHFPLEREEDNLCAVFSCLEESEDV